MKIFSTCLWVSPLHFHLLLKYEILSGAWHLQLGINMGTMKLNE